ncbi:MAG: phosphoribosylglycinamide formyltransferase [Nanoarchaeota archaeon]|nr:phosphoribosylglycinamide formyltransferase [Nanoarchaeota archaeon]MBU1030451.1 phosphoribosylglycinamide formyltransferase [Nanoarchaeota archaeon]MBU1849480.1 phosphoribosylglycinamide formyltransferase [Nanoarchaeota archaeon]
MKLNLGFLASHRGSNVEAILDNIKLGTLDAIAKVIISNNQHASVLTLGKNRNIPVYCFNATNTKCPDEKILETLTKHEVNLIILAGYMKLLGCEIINAYPNKILNIHPSLLPKHGGKGMYGLQVHKAVINSEDVESGATIHLVTENYDRGRILAQYKIPRYKTDTPETLAGRVLKVEHILYSQTLMDIQRGVINLDL